MVSSTKNGIFAVFIFIIVITFKPTFSSHERNEGRAERGLSLIEKSCRLDQNSVFPLGKTLIFFFHILWLMRSDFYTTIAYHNSTINRNLPLRQIDILLFVLLINHKVTNKLYHRKQNPCYRPYHPSNMPTVSQKTPPKINCGRY